MSITVTTAVVAASSFRVTSVGPAVWQLIMLVLLIPLCIVMFSKGSYKRSVFGLERWVVALIIYSLVGIILIPIMAYHF